MTLVIYEEGEHMDEIESLTLHSNDFSFFKTFGRLSNSICPIF